jgi:small subunit ribosomal protein S4e
MVKKHLKRHAAPKTWRIKRKDNTFITRPHPGAHSLNRGVSMNLLLKMLGYAKTSKEAKRVLQMKEVLVDGKKVIEPKQIIGLMDLINIPSIKKVYRIILGKDGKITTMESNPNDSLIKPCKITCKTVMKKGKVQLNLFDGKNIIVEKDSYKVGDTVILEFPKNTIKQHIKLEKGAYILLTAGKHIADQGVIEEIQGTKVIYKNSENEMLTTMKKYAFAIGKDKPTITIDKK